MPDPRDVKPQGDVGFLDVFCLDQRRAQALLFGGGELSLPFFSFWERAEFFFHQRLAALCVYIAGDDHSDVSSGVKALVEPLELLGSHGLHGLSVADDGAAVGVPLERLFEDIFDAQVAWVVFASIQLFEDDLELGVQLVLVEGGVPCGVGEDVHRQRQLLFG